MVTINCVTKPFEISQLQSFIGINNLEFNLSPVVEMILANNDTAQIIKTMDSITLRLERFNINIVDGGWCDLINNQIDTIPNQIEITRKLGANKLRLFFSPFDKDKTNYHKDIAISNVIHNIKQLAMDNSDITFLYETHRGIGLDHRTVKFIMERVGLDNVGLVFDPVNFLSYDLSPKLAFNSLKDFIKHTHIKGINDKKQLCSFGVGVNTNELILDAIKYCSSIGIEYEGTQSPFIGLSESYKNITKLLADHNIPYII
jgi:hypothetical protein